ncbi:FkbM family methyltransferase [Candidatus Pelagibacter sp. Uisw_092]|uniref:FkbM family methyltransferase n=1 Tax=Candidatus Pelagibacter sp. Uisw_092 TaxID=3230979 RepID=UPI0039E84267
MKIVLLILDFFDFFHKRKLINFLKKKVKLKNIDLLIDVGAHTGETIDLFSENFLINKIISFEASPKNFQKLLVRKNALEKKYGNTDIILENIALGNENKKINIKEFCETSSSTIQDIDEDSKYYKKKFKLLNFFGNNKIYDEVEIHLTKFQEYIKLKNINYIDFLKIDTEGYEYEILKGLGESIKDVNFIYFEHHYDLMLKKNYTFTDIHKILKMNNFSQIYKINMPFRKVFEYIYQNDKQHKND